MSELEDQIKVVAGARMQAVKLNEVKKLAYDKFQSLNAEMFGTVATAVAVVSTEEEKLRELALEAYIDDPTNKHPAVGVGIREQTVLTYDGKVAFDWAKSHKMALKLDTKAFEKIAKADTPDFVKITTEATATIATKLEV